MSKPLTSPFGTLHFDRYPPLSHPSLQAFDAADEYLLNELTLYPQLQKTKVLILNDNFGALATSLAEHFTVDSYGDSHLAELALYQNLRTNMLPLTSVNFIASTQPLKKNYDIVLIRIPKTLALLEEQLITLHTHVHPQTVILAGAMIKHLPRMAGQLIEKYLGTVQASLAVKKARLLRVKPQTKSPAQSPYPSQYHLKEWNITLLNHANVFSREGLDIGTRAFLPHLPQQLGHAKVADLGCGNGILGIVCALNNPQAEFTLVDESYMAIASANSNWQQQLPDRPATILVADGLVGQANYFDIVLCNPPFHQQQVIGDFIAKQMFQQAKVALKEQGELWIVANRHLGYHVSLKKLFKQVVQLAQTPKFIILKAIK